MKKNAICIFSLLFWALLMTTFLSARVEEEMIPLVVLTKPSRDMVLTEDTLFYDQNGAHLYQAVEGSGWESGTRAQEVSPDSYFLRPEGGILSPTSSDFVQFSTRPFTSGDLLQTQAKREKSDDYWLVTCYGERPEVKELPRKSAVEAQTDSALLISVKNSQLPFFAEQAASKIYWENPVTVAPEDAKGNAGLTDKSFFSLLETERFLDQLPLLAVLIVILLVTVALWAVSCWLAKAPKRNRRLLLTNIFLAAAMTVGAFFLLKAIQLPSSLLPQRTITDFGYYNREFSEIFSALRELSAAGSLPAADLINHANTITAVFFAIAGAGAAAAIAIILLEHRLAQNSASRKKKKAAADTAL